VQVDFRFNSFSAKLGAMERHTDLSELHRQEKAKREAVLAARYDAATRWKMWQEG
jgi:hypothetical protein